MLGTRDLPRVPELQPLVGHLDLLAIACRLIEDPELVTDAIADRGNAQCGQRIHVAGSEAAEAAVAEAGLLFFLQQIIEVLSEPRERPCGGVPDPEVEQMVAQMRPGQEFRREIRDHLCPRLQHGVERCQVPTEQAIANGQRERHVPVMAACFGEWNRLLVVQLVSNGGGDRLFAESGSNRVLVAWGGGRVGVAALSDRHDHVRQHHSFRRGGTTDCPSFAPTTPTAVHIGAQRGYFGAPAIARSYKRRVHALALCLRCMDAWRRHPIGS
jgi:hypothetical protein